MLKHGKEIRIISSHPCAIPSKEETFHQRSNVTMNILKVQRICPILRDILHMAHHMMFCLSSVFELVYEVFNVD